ncbi:MAG: hypothetical protein P9F19_19785 [Candidatus Contendobacter sp.]|nr:hypothetical protein [Candidatus Contendobacter sp.]
MSHTLFCNLDPAWDFVHWAHHHALDAFARPDVAFWQIEEPGGAAPDPPETIEVRDADFARTGTLLTPYLRGCARIALTRLPAS